MHSVISHEWTGTGHGLWREMVTRTLDWLPGCWVEFRGLPVWIGRRGYRHD